VPLPTFENDLLRSVDELRSSICEAADFREAAQLVLKAASELPGIDAVGIYGFDPNGGLRLIAGRGVSANFAALFSYFPPDSIQVREVLKGQSLCCKCSQLPEDRAQLYSAEGIQAIAIHPVKHKEHVVASLHLGCRTLAEVSPRLLSQVEVFASGLANTIVRIGCETRIHTAYLKVEDEVRDRTTALQQAIDALHEQIQARVAAEEKLKQSVSLLRATLDSTTEGLLVVDRSGIITGYNSRFVEMWSLPPGILESRDRALEFAQKQLKYPEPFLARIEQLYGAPLEESVDTLEFLDGRIYERYSRPQLVDGVPTGRVWCFRDITRQKRNEDALKDAARRKDEFLAMLGHELRNPLAPIRNASHLLKMIGNSDPRVQQARDVIERQVGHLGRMVDDLLDASRIAAGKITLEKERVDWARMIRTQIEDYRTDVEGRGLSLVATIPDEPVWVFGDPTRLSQIFTNLLANAQKFSNIGGRISVQLRVDSTRQCALLSVSDTGIGMSTQVLKRVFERFVQVDSDATRSRGGLGLGLWLVKGLVERHGGSVEASSAGLGRGSLFTVKLPLAHAPAAPECKECPGPKVMIIESDSDAMESLAAILELIHCTVEKARDGKSGIKAAKSEGPDIIFCTIELPNGIDGYAVARAVRADSATRSIYLVAMAGYDQEIDRLRAREAGFDLHLAKPIDPAELERIVKSVPARRC
jgi:signal transduction histidine kinase/ActR/RegA family two-component response regulator